MQSNTTFEQHYRALSILRFSLAAGQLIFAVVAYILVQNQGAFMPGVPMPDWLPLLIGGFTIATLFLGYTLANKRNATLSELPDTQQKFQAHRVNSLLQWALWESASLLSIVAFMLFAYLPFLLVPLVVIVITVLYGNGKDAMLNTLGIDMHHDLFNS